MSARPGSAARPMTRGSAAPVAHGTATRLTTGAAPGTGRPGTRGGGAAGGGVALSSQLHVADRPVTQQGLGGPKTAGARGGQRLVQDKTYFIGVLRSKINELTSEIGRLKSETETLVQDQSTYVNYEKRAEALALELKDLQAELGDYNTLVDRLNTDANISDMQMDYNDHKAQNDRESSMMEKLFEQKQQLESTVRQLEGELKQQRNIAENMVLDMPEDMRRRYAELKDKNENLLKQLENGQQEIDRLNLKRAELEDEISASPYKQEAVRLHEQLRELEDKRDQLMKEVSTKLTPDEERSRLLKQVKDDHAELATMERQIKEINERLQSVQDENQQLEQDLEDNQGTRSQQYKKLKQKEEAWDDFLTSFEENKAKEVERIKQLQTEIVRKLETISRDMSRSGQLPTPQQLDNMKDDLTFKEKEMEKAQATATGLNSEKSKVADDLQKIEKMETKLLEEKQTLPEKIAKMEQEIQIYSDLDKLRTEAEIKKQKLTEDKTLLHKRRDTLKGFVDQANEQYKTKKAQLDDNETYKQLYHLECKWKSQEQNNFVVKEFIAAKTRETDFHETSKKVTTMISSFNQNLIDMFSGKGAKHI